MAGSYTVQQLKAIAAADAQKYGINPNIFIAQINQESGFQTSVTSYAGAQGIAQFMPATAKAYGINPFDPVQALDAGARYDKNEMNAYGSDYSKILAAYNEGGGAVNNQVAAHGANWLSYAPAQTQNYVKAILGASGSTAVPNTVINTTGSTKSTQTATPTTTANAATPSSSSTSSGGNGLFPNVSIQWPSIYDFFGIQQISWQDVGIRALLIVVGAILIIAVAVKALAKPAVEITETAGRFAE